MNSIGFVDMVSEVYANLVWFVVTTLIGIGLGVLIANRSSMHDDSSGRPEFSAPSSDVDRRSLLTNAGVLYATLIIVIGSVVSNWPPEGQAFPQRFSDVVFFGSILATAAITTRVGLLIYRVEMGKSLV